MVPAFETYIRQSWPPVVAELRQLALEGMIDEDELEKKNGWQIYHASRSY